MFLKRINSALLRCQYNLCGYTWSRMCSLPAEVEFTDDQFFMNLLGMSKNEVSILTKQAKFSHLHKEDVKKSYDFLKQYNMTGGIKNYPGILATNAASLKNRYGVLEECSFCQITIAILHKYVTVMNKPISLVRSHGYIPAIEVIAKNLAEIAKFKMSSHEVKKFEANGSLKELRKYFINGFLQREIGATEDDLKRIWHSYDRLRNRPIATMMDVIELLREEMHFSNEKILNHAYLLHGEPENMRKILSLDKLSGRDAREVLSQHPKIFMSNHKSIVEITDILTQNGISDVAMQKNGLLFSLSPQTIAKRVAYLKEIDEFRVLLSHPRICRLIYFQNKAVHRLNYLKDNKIFCASLNVLSGDTESFQRYVQTGVEATKGRDMIFIFSKKLKRSVKEVREYFSRHPNWCHVPIVSMHAVCDHLIEKGYTESDIFSNVHILFYPLPEIIKKFEAIEQGSLNFTKDIDWRSLSKSQFLALVLYAIEIEFNFSGDGIWATSCNPNESSVQEKSEEIQANIN